MRKFLAVALLLLFSTISLAETLANNPYYREMQKKFSVARDNAEKNVAPIVAPRINPSSSRSAAIESVTPLKEINRYPSSPRPTVDTPPPRTFNNNSQNLSTLTENQHDEQKDNASPAFNIFVPPSDTTNH